MTNKKLPSINSTGQNRFGAGYHTQTWKSVGKPRALSVHCAPERNAYRSETMDPGEISRLIEGGFEKAVVRVRSDDNTHFEALVVAAEFEGKRPLARHQLVYKTLGTLMGNEIHALSIRALTPDEWQQQAD